MTRQEMGGAFYTEDDMKKAFEAGKAAISYYHDVKDGYDHYWETAPVETAEEFLKTLKR